jgi:hypothetical protein
VFNFRINAPLYYNSNATEALSGGPPEIELGWNRSLALMPLKPSVKLRADTTRFANVPQADEDKASGSIKASYYDASDDQTWAPFVSYKSTGIFDPSFSSWAETKNGFALGLEKLSNFDGYFHLMPAAAHSRAAGVWLFGLSVYVQRMRTPGPDSTAAYAVPSVTYAASKEWTMSLFLNTRERWFDSGASFTTTPSRRDFEVEPIVTILCDPTDALFGGGNVVRWRPLGSPQTALQIAFENRSSNIVNRSWSQWAIGPILTAN